MISVDPKAVKTGHLHALILGAIAPRPIAFASTVDQEGNPNLSPYSFFNAFGSNPTTLIFSPARRVRDNTIKHTLENVYETREVVINVVTYGMVQQASLASCEYPKGVNEFVKAGFTPLASERVRPFRVKESPVQFECTVRQVIETGDQGGAGNLIICEIVLMHVSPDVMDSEGKIDQHKIDLVGRCGHNYYSRASGSALFEVPKPNLQLGIGMDHLPEDIRTSAILTGNELAMLANTQALPDQASIHSFMEQESIRKLAEELKRHPESARTARHLAARELIHAHHIDDAWKVLLMPLDV